MVGIIPWRGGNASQRGIRKDRLFAVQTSAIAFREPWVALSVRPWNASFRLSSEGSAVRSHVYTPTPAQGKKRGRAHVELTGQIALQLQS